MDTSSTGVVSMANVYVREWDRLIVPEIALSLGYCHWNHLGWP